MSLSPWASSLPPPALVSSPGNGAHQFPRKLSVGVAAGPGPGCGLLTQKLFAAAHLLPALCQLPGFMLPRVLFPGFSEVQTFSPPLGVPQDGGGRQRTLRVPLNQWLSSTGPKCACFINCRELCKPKVVVVGESSCVLWHK